MNYEESFWNLVYCTKTTFLVNVEYIIMLYVCTSWQQRELKLAEYYDTKMRLNKPQRDSRQKDILY